jgi:hypothetical protein
MNFHNKCEIACLLTFCFNSYYLETHLFKVEMTKFRIHCFLWRNSFWWYTLFLFIMFMLYKFEKFENPCNRAIDGLLCDLTYFHIECILLGIKYASKQ